MEFALGTVCVINLYEGGSNKLYSRIFSRIREIDRTMGAFPGEFQDMVSGEALVKPGSKTEALIRSAADMLVSGVVAINRQAGIEPVKVRPDLIKVLETAIRYADLSDGLFDPTVGPLVKLWGIGTDVQRVPGVEEIAAALELVNWHDLVIDRENGTVFLKREGMALDLGAIAKGYAGDEALKIAAENRVKRAVFDLGGNIVTLGWREKSGKNNLPWRIGIQDPLKERGAYIGVLAVHDTSVVTSGVYERFFDKDGKHYHHLMSTEDGFPVDNGLLSVTIVTSLSIEADALSTVVFTLGYEKGRVLIDTIPEAEAIFIFDDQKIIITDGLSGIFTLTSDEYVFN